MIRAIHLRERYIDSYDPPSRFKWIVEMQPYLGTELIYYYHTIDEWNANNSIARDAYVVSGVRVGFVERDDALLFYIAFS